MATHQGKVFKFTFEYQDPWEWMLSIVQDESLVPMAMWNSVWKYYCAGDLEECIYDEPNTADTWWDVDVSLHISAKYAILFFPPKSELLYCDLFPHSYLPLHFWLDKGMVTWHVRKYPMLLHPAWLPHQIRNASGNRGGILIRYMPIVCHKYLFKNKYSYELRLKIHQIHPATLQQRRRSLHTSNERYTRRFWRRFFTAWSSVHKMVKLIIVWMVLTGSFTLVFWLNHKMLKKWHISVAAMLLKPIIHVLNASLENHICTISLGILNCVLWSLCKEYFYESQRQKQRLQRRKFWKIMACTTLR